MGAKRILLVDDEVPFTNLVKLNLEKHGRYEVRVENSPATARSAIRDFRPDLVLLDVIMPGKDGGQVLNEIRSDPDSAHIPVLFLTATITQQGVDDRAGTIRGVPFIAKPVEPKRLEKRIEQVLAGD